MKTPQFAHQIEDTATLVKHPAFAIFSEMGTGKSKIVIDAACELAAQEKIDTVVVVAPASVRCVWIDEEIGEIRKHVWVPSNVFEFHRKITFQWSYHPLHKTRLSWIVTNYEFLRGAAHLEELIEKLEGRSTLLVLDESSYVKNRAAAQTKAVMKLREHCARCVLLNGTPITNSPLDLWSQMQILNPEILGKCYKNFYHFRYEYCEIQQMRMGVRTFPKIVRYKNLEKLTKILAPYVLRREKKDCLDLPPKLYTEREVALTPASWKRYQELKKDCILTLSKDDVRLEPNAAVRLMRLAQLTSGILGSAASPHGDELGTGGSVADNCPMQDLSDEKLRWAVQYLTEECTAKAVIVWTRWRRERERLAEALKKFPIDVFQLYGGQSKKENWEGKLVFKPGNSVPRNHERAILIAQPQAGGLGNDMALADQVWRISHDHSVFWFKQSEDRPHRIGQINSVLYGDVIAVGPHGEKTIDSINVKALHSNIDTADWTCAQWRKELSDE